MSPRAIGKGMVFAAVVIGLSVAWGGEAVKPPRLEKLTGAEKDLFVRAFDADAKRRDEARKKIGEWPPLAKAAAEELRTLIRKQWRFAPPNTGWKKPPGKKGGMRTIRVEKLGDREYFLHVPAGYTSQRNWPLLVSLHGAGGTGEGDYDWLWAKWERLWDGFVACPSGVPPGAQWFPEQRPFVLGMLNDVRKTFPIDDNRVALHGFSNGGNGAWFYALYYPSLWCGVITRAGSPYREDLFKNLMNVGVAVVHGEKDSVIPAGRDRDAANALKVLKYNVIHKEIPAGGHEPFDDKTNPELLPWLRKLERPAWPKKIVFRPPDDESPRAYWLEAGANGAAAAEVTAEVKEGNRVALTASGVGEMTLWLSDDLVDLDKPVVVVKDGLEVFQEAVPRRASDLVDWFAATGDRATAPVARIKVR
ncbi:MAG: hypothetical protein V1809_13010 [Planctomycetota bacterium]